MNGSMVRFALLAAGLAGSVPVAGTAAPEPTAAEKTTSVLGQGLGSSWAGPHPSPAEGIGYAPRPADDLPPFRNFYRGYKLRPSANGFGMALATFRFLADKYRLGAGPSSRPSPPKDRKLTEVPPDVLMGVFERLSDPGFYESVAPGPDQEAAAVRVLRRLEAATQGSVEWIATLSNPGQQTVGSGDKSIFRGATRRRYLGLFRGKSLASFGNTKGSWVVFDFYDPHGRYEPDPHDGDAGRLGKLLVRGEPGGPSPAAIYVSEAWDLDASRDGSSFGSGTDVLVGQDGARFRRVATGQVGFASTSRSIWQTVRMDWKQVEAGDAGPAKDLRDKLHQKRADARKAEETWNQWFRRPGGGTDFGLFHTGDLTEENNHWLGEVKRPELSEALAGQVERDDQGRPAVHHGAFDDLNRDYFLDAR